MLKRIMAQRVEHGKAGLEDKGSLEGTADGGDSEQQILVVELEESLASLREAIKQGETAAGKLASFFSEHSDLR
ncbi:MAG: hypothetical protein LBR56_04570 [Sporomusaceae bacterium]|jgi:hypothetical protein|nr:hypothetical protein [Sporomusaceae bacterium]